MTAYVPGWDWAGSRLTQLIPDGTDDSGEPKFKREQKLSFNVIPRKILRDEDGRVESIAAVIQGLDERRRVVVFPASLVTSAQPSRTLREETGITVPPREAQWLLQFISTIVNDGRVKLPETRGISVARWENDSLVVPGPYVAVPDARELDKYGSRADITEELARKRWRGIVELALERGNEKFALVLGMPIGSMYAERFWLPTFALHVAGESHQGKTEGTEAAMNTIGLATKPHGPLYRTWNNSPRAFTNIAKRLGIMPLYLDEAATFDGTPEQWTSVVFELAQGRARAVADTAGGLTTGSDDTWMASILSTGEIGITGKSNLTGMRRRVLEIRAPLVTSDVDNSRDPGNDSQRAVNWTREAHGWPLYWLVNSPDPSGFERSRNHLLDAIYAELDESQKLAFVEADNVATCLAGFVTLGRLAGRDVLRATRAVARVVYSQLRDRAASEGSGLADRVVRAIRDDLATHPRNWPDALDALDELSGFERTGVTFDAEKGIVGIMSKDVLARLAQHDANTVLEVLRDSGHLEVPPSRAGFQARRRVWQRGQGVSSTALYVIRLRVPS